MKNYEQWKQLGLGLEEKMSVVDAAITGGRPTLIFEEFTKQVTVRTRSCL